MNWTPQIPLKFDGRGSRLYFSGETLAGSYFLDELGDEPIEAVEVSVLWHTEGKGSEDFGIHEFWRRSVADGDWIDNRTPGRFSTTLPNSPLSYDGELIKIFWSVRIRAFMNDGRQIVDEHPFRLGNITSIRTLRMTHEKSLTAENAPSVPMDAMQGAPSPEPVVSEPVVSGQAVSGQAVSEPVVLGQAVSGQAVSDSAAMSETVAGLLPDEMGALGKMDRPEKTRVAGEKGIPDENRRKVPPPREES